MSEYPIEVNHLYKSYGKTTAVDDLSFRVANSVCVGFLGPNGAGKTTTMKLLYGKAKPDSNRETEIAVFGHDPRTNELAIKAMTGIAPQEDNLDEELNVLQNLKIYSKLHGMSWKIARPRVEGLLDFMELREREKSSVRTLSGGMKRRLIMARALLNDPILLILDEPTTGLDPQVRQLIWNKLRELKRQGVTILLTTHYMEEAYQMADQIIIMDRGKKVLEGEPRGLLERHIESHVLEVMSRAAVAQVQGVLSHGARVEQSGDFALYYSNEIEMLEGAAASLAPGDYFLRTTNLEDLFLRATGRNLNELQ